MRGPIAHDVNEVWSKASDCPDTRDVTLKRRSSGRPAGSRPSRLADSCGEQLGPRDDEVAF